MKLRRRKKKNVLPEGNIRQVILDDSTVANIRRETEKLPDGLRERVVQLRFAQAKRVKAYAVSGFIPCPSCGRWMLKEKSFVSFAAAPLAMP